MLNENAKIVKWQLEFYSRLLALVREMKKDGMTGAECERVVVGECHYLCANHCEEVV